MIKLCQDTLHNTILTWRCNHLWLERLRYRRHTTKRNISAWILRDDIIAAGNSPKEQILIPPTGTWRWNESQVTLHLCCIWNILISLLLKVFTRSIKKPSIKDIEICLQNMLMLNSIHFSQMHGFLRQIRPTNSPHNLNRLINKMYFKHVSRRTVYSLFTKLSVLTHPSFNKILI